MENMNERPETHLRKKWREIEEELCFRIYSKQQCYSILSDKLIRQINQIKNSYKEFFDDYDVELIFLSENYYEIKLIFNNCDCYITINEDFNLRDLEDYLLANIDYRKKEEKKLKNKKEEKIMENMNLRKKTILQAKWDKINDILINKYYTYFGHQIIEEIYDLKKIKKYKEYLENYEIELIENDNEFQIKITFIDCDSYITFENASDIRDMSNILDANIEFRKNKNKNKKENVERIIVEEGYNYYLINDQIVKVKGEIITEGFKKLEPKTIQVVIPN